MGNAIARRSAVCSSILFTAAVLAPHACVGAEQTPEPFIGLSLEQLGNIEVTSVSKQSEPLSDAAASIYVITGEAIRSAGVTSLPEALRLAPNLQVARINASEYAISARGFNSSTANKLLVMIDGRSVYTPLYSGVFWDAQDVAMSDIERIEVISGAGGTLWGANAVNGVINIITKSAQSTAGNLAQGAVDRTGNSVTLRHGGVLGDDPGDAYRIYAKFNQYEHSTTAAGPAQDSWSHQQIGFRSDLGLQNGHLTVQGDAYKEVIDPTLPGTENASGANLLSRWERALDNGASWRLQLYYDRTNRDVPGSFSEQLDTLDLDVQYSLPTTGAGHWIVGGGSRMSDDHVGNTDVLAFLPADRRLHWSNVFAQHERPLSAQLRFTAGLKVEYNDYTGLELLPSMKLAWKPTEQTLIWSALSRAVREPSRLDTDLYSPAKPPFYLAGGPDFRSEVANSLDLGTRLTVGKQFSYSLTGFYSQYSRLRSIDILPDQSVVLANQIQGHVLGLETWGSYQVSKRWSLRAGGMLLDERFSGAGLALSPPGSDPHAQCQLGSRWELSESQAFDVGLRYVGRLSNSTVPSYAALDAHYDWKLSRDWALVLSGRNLSNPGHQEFASSGTPGGVIVVERTVAVTLTARF